MEAGGKPHASAAIAPGEKNPGCPLNLKKYKEKH
jgi:hypothetical protein